MILTIESHVVYFPFEEILPEQIQIMFILQKLWKKKCTGIIGIPPTITLPASVISFYLSSQTNINNGVRLIYITDTFLEIEKIFHEIEKFDEEIRRDNYKKEKSILLSTSFFKKSNLCINSKFKKKQKIDELEDFCLSLILPEIKKKKIKAQKLNFRKFDKKHSACIYYKNLMEKKIKKINGLWNFKNIRSEAFRKKICPFYFSRELIFESQIITIEFKNFFSSEILGLDLKKLLKESFLIVDSLKNLNCIFANLAMTEINSLILKDSMRGLLYLKKKILKSSANKFSYFTDKTPFKNFFDLNRFDIFTNSNKRENLDKDYNFFVYENMNSRRGLELIIILTKIVKFIQSILNKKIKINLTLDQFYCVLYHKLKGYHFFPKYLTHFSDYITLLTFKSRVLNFRFLKSLKYLSWFLLKFGIYSESMNENFRILTIINSTSKNLPLESILFLCCFEIPIFSRLIFENSMSLLIFTTQSSSLYSNISIFDQSQIFYGNLNLIFKKGFISQQEIIFGENDREKNYENFIEGDGSLSKKIISTLIRISTSSVNGVICLFSSYSLFLEVIENLNNPVTLGQIKKKRNMFIETLSNKTDVILLEKYKLSCDLGFKSIFFGLSEGLLSRANIENHYSRFILNIQTRMIFPDKFRRIYFFWHKFFKSHYSFSHLIEHINYTGDNFLFRKFFGSKKDYGIFLNLKNIFEFEKISHKFKIEIIKDKGMLKESNLSNTHEIDRFFTSFSYFNLGS